MADRSRRVLRQAKSRGAPTEVGPRRSLLRRTVESQRKQRHIGAEEGFRRVKATEFRHSRDLERPTKGSMCLHGTWQKRKSDHGEPC